MSSFWHALAGLNQIIIERVETTHWSYLYNAVLQFSKKLSYNTRTQACQQQLLIRFVVRNSLSTISSLLTCVEYLKDASDQLEYSNMSTIKELNLSKKVEAIQASSTGKSQRTLASHFRISKSQVQRILANKDDILARHRKNAPVNSRRCSTNRGHAEID